MSHRHSPQSSSEHGPSSSPFGGTDPTQYSPDMDRKGHRRQVTAIAMGKRPIEAVEEPAPTLPSILPPAPAYVEGAFINEMSEEDRSFMSRYQFVTQLPDGTNAGLDPEHELFQVQHQMKLYQCFDAAVPYYARGVFIRYDDLREAAEGKILLEQHDFSVAYATSYDYARGKSQDTAHIKEFEGQMKLAILIEPNPEFAVFDFTAQDLATVSNAVEITARSIGDLRNVVHVDTIDEKMLLVYRIEYHSVDAAIRAVQSLIHDPVWGASLDNSFHWCTFDPAPWTGERALASPHRFKPRVDALGRFYGYRPATVHLQLPDRWSDRRSNQSAHPHDQHNRVRRQRILDGSDVRTTVMLRNIPNKLDWMALKNILDDVCFGTYDFLYLRIDFKSGCNVGYAFINFTDANGMLAIIDRMERRSWPGFTSDKTAEISYATIQGREALVQKFRNSSVMQETPFCRPRLVVTIADARNVGRLRVAGTEQEFPRPDNLSKLQRSMDSARSIGLYPPHGYSSVIEHRNRTSAYDRGGPRDMMQAAMHFAHQRAAPIQFAGLTDAQKRDIEMWYLNTYGGGHCGRIPFDCIPMTHVTQYFNENLPAPGIIGGPVGTPTRPSRAGPSSSYAGPSSSYAGPSSSRAGPSSSRRGADEIHRTPNPFL
ncbi:hypothetical protein PTNB85_01203 [Pyrenophora teres f. teres]|nr:hypothetical protein PTNB85_01203 [Pyrenophora teres f. teres]KAE8869853.1 hypothetical protein PTNB29_00197 [Pyrenophora teres f. teres]